MLKSRKSNMEMEKYVVILSEDLGEVLAESLVVRHFSGVAEEDYAAVFEGLREGLLLFMTPGEFAALKMRIEAESREASAASMGIDAAE